MSVTNLAGTTWKMNDTLDFSQFSSSNLPYIYREEKTTTKYIYVYTADYVYDICFHMTYSGHAGKYVGLGFNSNGISFNYGAGTGYSGSVSAAQLAGGVICFLPNTVSASIIGLDDSTMISWFEANGKLVNCYDLSTMGLPEGVYSITAKSLAQDYLTSPESSPVEYDHYNITNLSGTTWRISTDTYKRWLQDDYYLGFSGKVSYGDYVIDNAAQRWVYSPTENSMRYSNTDVQSGTQKIYPLFLVTKSGITVQPSASSTPISIPYVDIYIAGKGTGYYGSRYDITTNARTIRWFRTNTRLLSKS